MVFVTRCLVIVWRVVLLGVDSMMSVERTLANERVLVVMFFFGCEGPGVRRVRVEGLAAGCRRPCSLLSTTHSDRGLRASVQSLCQRVPSRSCHRSWRCILRCLGRSTSSHGRRSSLAINDQARCEASREVCLELALREPFELTLHFDRIGCLLEKLVDGVFRFPGPS